MKLPEKLKSRKLWVTIWAMLMLSYALVTKVDLAWFNSLAPILGLTVATYIGINGYLEGKTKQSEATNEDK